MAVHQVQSGSFTIDGPLIIATTTFAEPTPVRCAFTVLADQAGFTLRADGSDGGGGAFVRGEGVHAVDLGELPAGGYTFLVEPQGYVKVSSFAIFAGANDPVGPDETPDGPDLTPPKVILARAVTLRS